MAEQDLDKGEDIPADSVENEPGHEEWTQAGKERVNGSDELASLLEYDPFEDTGGGESEAPAGQEGSGTGEGEGTGEQAKGQEAGQPSQPSGQEDPAQLRQQLDEALRTIHHIREGQGQQQGAQPGQQGQMGAPQDQQAAGQQADGQQAQEGLPNYQFQIPDQLLQMMDSDDPTQRKQALTYLGQGVAQTVHQMVRQEMEQKMGNLRQEIPREMQQVQATQEQQKQVFEDFYGTYQDLNRPELRPTIVEVAKAVAQEYSQQGKPVQWGPEFKQAVANRTYQVLGRSPGGQQQQQARKPSQPRNFGGNARRGVGQPDTEQADIERTLFG